MVDNQEIFNDFERSKKRKVATLEALKACKGIVTHACAAANVSRPTFYNWIKQDEDFAKAVDDMQDYVLDLVEDTALSMITEDRNTAVTIFYLKTKGRDRGYQEKREIIHTLSEDTKNLIGDCDEEMKEYEREY